MDNGNVLAIPNSSYNASKSLDNSSRSVRNGSREPPGTHVPSRSYTVLVTLKKHLAHGTPVLTRSRRTPGRPFQIDCKQMRPEDAMRSRENPSRHGKHGARQIRDVFEVIGATHTLHHQECLRPAGTKGRKQLLLAALQGGPNSNTWRRHAQQRAFQSTRQTQCTTDPRCLKGYW